MSENVLDTYFEEESVLDDLENYDFDNPRYGLAAAQL